MPEEISNNEYKNAVLEHLREILDLELSINKYEEAIDGNQKNINRLCIAPPPQRPQSKAEASRRIAFVYLVCPIAVVLLAAILFAILLPDDFPLGTCLWMPSVNLLGVFVGLVIANTADNKRLTGIHNQDIAAYNQQMIIENDQRNFHLAQINMLRELINETKQTLEVLYDNSILHLKYHNLKAVASFFNYFSTGRTYSLELNGSDRGAYNIFEEDVNFGRVVESVDRV
ncbi:MAG: hypothetical protein FWE94_03645, partial [Coriobacteriia bacterium]|nr:hypothetical protein [Coriobacteriia bacterium]